MLTKEIVNAIRSIYSNTIAQDFKNSKVIPYKRIDGKEIVECSGCGEIFFLDEVTVHHSISVIPPQITYKQISYHLFHERLNCSWSSLQLLCLPCHQDKGIKEDQERRYWKDRKKQLICRSKIGGRMHVNPVVNLDDLDPKWEVMDVALTRGEADSKFRKWRKS